MAIKLGDAFVALGTKDELDKGLNAARAKVNGWLSNITQGVAQGIGQAVAGAIGNTIRIAFSEVEKSVIAADKLNESLIRTGKVFGENATDVRAWAQEAAKALGLSEEAALSNASALGSMLVQLGANRDQAASMSKQMIEAAADIAAFRGVTGGAAEVLDTFAAGFRGEYDSLQKFLPAITDASIKQQALADTGKTSEKQLTNLEKALATQTLILQGAAIAAGSFADATARGANAQEVFAARMENARAQLGQVGLIIQQEFFGTLNELLDSMGFYGENIVEQLVVGLTKGLVAITPFLAQLRGVFVKVLKPGSPPKLLPELNDWGKAAAEEYLKGWSLADGKSLETLGSGIESVLRSFAGSGRLKQTDLVSRVFGSQKAIVGAINEWRQLGTISVGTLNAIQRAAGPAGDNVGNLVSAYFDLQNAAKNASDAQQRLSDVTRRYDAVLSPLNAKLDALQGKQQEIRDQQRLVELDKVIGDRRADIADKQLARLEKEEIQLRQQVGAIEDERDAAVDAEQQKIDAAEKERQAKQEVYDQQQAILDQQVKANALIQEEVALRQQLADEVLAKEEKARRELEAQRSKEQSDLERIAAAQLRYQLATTDTAGQLEIMRAELAKVAVGSADYFDILTQIAGLEERLATERAGDAGGASNAITEAGNSAQENTKYLDEFRIALEGATGALFGGDGKTVELAPAWQTFADTLGTIGDAAKEVAPRIQTIIDLVMGKEVTTKEGGADPFGDNWWLRGIIPGLDTILGYVTTFQATGWAGVWAKIKQNVFDTVNAIDPETDPRSFTFYAWLQDIVIPAIDAFAAGDWSTAIGLLTSPIRTMVDAAYTNGKDWIGGFWQGIIDGFKELPRGFVEDFMRRYGFPTNPFEETPGINPNKQRIDPGTLPQSYNLPGAGSLMPAMASASSGMGGTTTVHNYLELPLIFNVPVTNDIARSAAATVDEELRRRGWAPT